MSLSELRPALKPLKASKDAVWLVGGCLRDALLDRPLRDVDMATAGDPLKLAKKLGAALKSKPFPLDAKRGIYRVVAGGRVFDFCRLQGKTIEQDVQKRDFRLNALALPLEAVFAADWKKCLIDLVEGRKDVRDGKIGLVAESALQEDPLRLMRAFRIAAELDFAIEPKTLAAITQKKSLLSKSAAERVRDELFKIFATPRAGATLAAMDRARLLTVVFPEGEGLRETAHVYYGKEGVWGHSLAALASLDKLLAEELDLFFRDFAAPLKAHMQEPIAGYPRYALLKLVELLHDVGKPATAKMEKGKLHFHGHDHVGMKLAEKAAARLRLSNDETRSLGRMVGSHMRPGNLGHAPALTDRAIYRFYRDLEADAVGMLVVALADHFTYLSDKQRKTQKDPVFLAIRKLLSHNFLRRDVVQPPKLVDGTWVMEKLELPAGPQIGRILNGIREAQAAGQVKTQAQALKLAQKLMQSKVITALVEKSEAR